MHGGCGYRAMRAKAVNVDVCIKRILPNRLVQ